MSIAGIAKEVTTITISAWFFGDELTPLNITGVAITVCGMLFRFWGLASWQLLGISLFTYHKYRKSIDSPVPLDAHGNPLPPDEDDSGHALDMSAGYQLELDETSHLTRRMSGELDSVRTVMTDWLPDSSSVQAGGEPLFVYADEDDESGDEMSYGRERSKMPGKANTADTGQRGV
jgi:solute carrier family 35, member C2